MRFSKAITFDAPPDVVFAMLSDPEFRMRCAAEAGADSYDATVTPNGDGIDATLDTEQSTQGLPGLARKFLGSTFALHQEEHWSSPSLGTMTVTVPNAGSFHGTVSLAASGTGSVQTVEADVKVGIPLVGGKIEALVCSGIGHSVKIQQRVGADWLTR